MRFQNDKPKGDGVRAVWQESKNPLQRSRESPAGAARGTNTEEEQNIQLGFTSKETTRRSKGYASTQTTGISRPDSCTPTCECFCNGALTPTTIRSADCDSWCWQWWAYPILSSLFVGTSGTTTQPPWTLEADQY